MYLVQIKKSNRLTESCDDYDYKKVKMYVSYKLNINL